MVKMLLYIGAGSAVGGVLRYLVTRGLQSLFPVAFPWGTFAVNVSGCFVIGLVCGLCDRQFCLSPELKAFLTVGLCGGFTTFSSFVNETYLLMESSGTMALLYTLASLVVGLMLVHIGYVLARSV